MQLLYEDFASAPRQTISTIAKNLGKKVPDELFPSDDAVRLGMSHTVSGNPARFRQGVIRIHPDVEWQEKLSKSDRVIVTVLTFPLMFAYGYLAHSIETEMSGGKL